MNDQRAPGRAPAPPADERPRPATRRLAARDPFVADGLVAVGLVGLGVVGLLAGMGPRGLPQDSAPPTALATLLVVGQSMPLAWRRRAPLTVLAVVEVSTVAYFLLHFPPTGAALGALLAFYTVAARCPTRLVVPYAAGFAAGVLALTASGRMSFEVFVLLHALFAAAWVLGNEQRARRAYTALVEDRAARLERELGYLAREAVADGRVRLTRELHRSVTDNVSAMVAAARAAGQALPGDADASRDLLERIRRTGDRTLAELLRGSEALSPADPVVAPVGSQSAMSQLSALVSEVKLAGLPIDVKVEGDAVPLPAAVDGPAYRIVQEALTSCLTRLGSARPQVLIRYGSEDLELQITHEPGSVWEVDPDGGRYENLGWMQRREPEPDAPLEGGFGVVARLPLGSAGR